MKRKKFVKRALSFFLALLMTLSYIPEIAYAYSVNDGTGYSISSDNVQFNDDASNDIDDAQISESNNDVSGEDASETISDNKTDNEEDDSNIQDDQEEQDDSDVDEVIEDDSISENDIDEESISENVAELEELEPVGETEYIENEVAVSYSYKKIDGETVWDTQYYASISDAFDALAEGTDFTPKEYGYTSPSECHYTFYIHSNQTMTDNFIIPSYVDGLSLISDDSFQNYSIDMAGYNISFSNDKKENALYLNVCLKNNSANQSKIYLNTGGNYNRIVIGNLLYSSELNTKNNPICVIDNVDIEDANCISLDGDSKNTAYFSIVNTELNTDQFSVNSGNWIVDEITSDTIFIGGSYRYEVKEDGTHDWYRASLIANTINVNDYADICDYAEIENLNINEASVNIERGTIWEQKGNELVSTERSPVSPIVKVGKFTVSNKTVNTVYVDSDAVLVGDTLDMQGGKLNNFGEVTFDDVYIGYGIGLDAFSTFTVGNLVMSSTAKAYFSYLSNFTVKETATIWNPYFAYSAWGSPQYRASENDFPKIFFDRNEGAEINFKGKLTCGNYLSLLFRTVDENGNLTGTEPGIVLFTDNMQVSIPLSCVEIEQPDGYLEYNALIKDGKDVKIAKKYFTVGYFTPLEGNTVWATVSYREKNELASFVKWSEAISYIDSLNDVTADYYIEISEDVDSHESFSVPKKARSFTVTTSYLRPYEDDYDRSEVPSLSFVGNITLQTETTFDNIIFEQLKATSSGYEDSTTMSLNTNGKALYLVNATFNKPLDSITGTGYLTMQTEGILNFGDDHPAFTKDNLYTLEVDGNVSIKNLSITGSVLKAGYIKATQAYLNSARLISNGNIDFTYLGAFSISEIVTGIAENNKLTVTNPVNVGCYYDYETLNPITVTGLSGADANMDMAINGKISLRSQYIENQIADDETKTSYADFPDHVFVTGKNVKDTDFLIGYSYDTENNINSALFTTRKDGDTIKVEVLATSVDIVEGDGALNLSAGGTMSLTAIVGPELASDKSVTWSSSDTSVAYVSSDGTIKGKGSGSATITVMANDKLGVSDSIVVNVIATGFNSDGDHTWYVKPDGTNATGWTTVGRRTYYFDPETSYMRTRWYVLDGNKYYFNPETGALQTGWHTIDDELYYFNPYTNGDVHAGAMVTGEFTYRGKTYFLDETTGAAVIGWRTVGDNRYYYDATGAMVSGLVSLGDGDYFFAANGTLVKNDFVEIDESVYYFDNDGKKVLGDDDYKEINGERFYLDPEGKVKTGWVDTDPSSEEKLVYCFETSGDNYVFGQVAVGLVEIKGNLYLFNETTSGYYYGEMMTGMQEYNNEWYMFGSDGIAVSGWQSDNGATYYFDPETKVAVLGMTVINKKTYYFSHNADGKPALLVNETVIIGGNEYKADANGVLKNVDNISTWVDNGDKKIFLSKNGTAVSGWVADGGLMYYCDPVTGEAVTGLKKIGLKVYLFDDDGALVTPNRNGVSINGNPVDIAEEVTVEVDGENKTYAIRADGSLVTGWIRNNGWKYIPSPVTVVGCQSGSPAGTDALGAVALSNDLTSLASLDMAGIAPVSYMNVANIGIVIPTHINGHFMRRDAF